MRQTTMDRWLEAAEAKRVFQIAHQLQARSIAPPALPRSLMTKLRSMVRPQISDRYRARAAATRSAA
jgi:hypothetical protein